ncbi:MAG: hypothetical protein QM487_00850 [Candidatus Marithrix sp.]
MKYFLILILSLNLLVANATDKNRYIDSIAFHQYRSDLNNFIRKVHRDTSKSYIKYQIAFVNKQNEPPLVSSIEINSHIDSEKNILFEAIKITYLPKRGYNFEAALKGEEINIYIDPFGVKNQDISIVDISAPGWRINKNNNSAHLTSLYDTLFNNTIHFILIVKNQNRYKRRIIDFYNLYGVDFYCKLNIDSSYNFTGFFPNLPFPSRDLPTPMNDIYNSFGASLTKQNQVQNNRILYQGYFVSDVNYFDDLKFYGSPPKTQMQFSYGYDFIRNTNNLIVEENKRSTKYTLDEIIRSSKEATSIALILFAISILISIIFHLYPKDSNLNKRTKEFFRIKVLRIKLWLNWCLKIIKRIFNIRLTKKKRK